MTRRDPSLGPLFDHAIDDWDHHLDELCALWSSVTLMTGRCKGAPDRRFAEDGRKASALRSGGAQAGLTPTPLKKQ